MYKIYHFNTIVFLITFTVLSSCSSCTKDFDEDGVSDKLDKCPDTAIGIKVDSLGCPIVEKQLGNIHIYIETSASMGGYFQNDAEFKTIISDLTTKIDNTIKPIDIWFTADSTTKYSSTVGQFSSDIATTKIANQKSSQLHKIIANITSKAGPNDITIFVSDCILSFPDEEIKKNREINRTEAPNALKNNIYETFSNLKKKDLATTIYAFRSKFYGTYYDYKNGKHSISGDRRPFYIWVIGNKELLPKFNEQLDEISTFNPEKILNFGLTGKLISSYEIISQIERVGSWMKDENGLKDIEIEGTTVQFCAALNLKDLPMYVTKKEYLQTNLKVIENGCKVKTEVKEKNDVDISKLRSRPQIEAFDPVTHVVVYKITEMNLSNASIHTYLPLVYDTWYFDWSIMDDTKISTIEGKTFAFEYLIQGVTEAYSNRDANYIDFSINLKK